MLDLASSYEGDLPGAKALVQDQDNMVANIAQTGIERLSDGLDSCQEAMEARTTLNALRTGFNRPRHLGRQRPIRWLARDRGGSVVTLGQGAESPGSPCDDEGSGDRPCGNSRRPGRRLAWRSGGKQSMNVA